MEAVEQPSTRRLDQMANAELVEAIRGGQVSFRAWQDSHPNHLIDCSGADLSEISLITCNLAAADLSNADLSGASLCGSFLNSADLRGARLSRANLSFAYMGFARCEGADITNADLAFANLQDASLQNAVMTSADLFCTNLSSTLLGGADFSRAQLGYTGLGDVNLFGTKGLADVFHHARSFVDFETLMQTFRACSNSLPPDIEAFLLAAGVPREQLDLLPRLASEVAYHSCFISYGSPDSEFAERLYEELIRRGVSCWLYKLDSTVGQPTWREIGQKRQEHEKMVILCSAPALIRPPVLKEIAEQVDEDTQKIVPVSLDVESPGLQGGERR
jgi:hypothetical protein